MFLDCVEQPLQKCFMFISALTFVEPLTDVPIGGVQYFHIFSTFTTCCRLFVGLIDTIVTNPKSFFKQINRCEKSPCMLD